MELGWLAYVLIFAGAASLGLVFTPLAMLAAERLQVLDRPGGHKSHDSPVPYLGGLAITLAFSLAIAAAATLRPPPGNLDELITILVAAVLLALVGLADDLRGASPYLRIAAEVAAGLALFAVGAGVQLFASAPLDALFTVLWVVGITNAFNLLDNMDGLSAGVASIAAMSFFAIAVMNGQTLVAALSIALAGCAIAFLRHNFHPARIYMGDAGALFLGFLVAAIGIRLRFDGPTQVTFFVPILVLGVAILDTSLVVLTRLLHRRNPFSGARDHISHRLVFVGVPVRVAVALIYGAAVAHGWLAVVMSRVDRTTGFLLMGLVVAVNLFFLVLLANVPVYDTSRQRRFMIREVAGHEEHARAGEEAGGVVADRGRGAGAGAASSRAADGAGSRQEARSGAERPPR